MIAIIDYGAGNLHSVKNALDFLGAKSIVTGDSETILNADKVILPGVGAFGDAMKCLEKSGLVETVKAVAKSGKPLLGICLGLHLMFEESDETPGVKGLGIFKGKIVKMIIVPNCAEQGRKFFDNMTDFAKEEAGASGLAWFKFDNEKTITGGISKFITENMKKELEEKFGLEPNSAAFFVADENLEKTQKIAGLVRIELGKRLDLIEKNIYKFCLIVDFPMYELSDEGTIDFNHNPFSMPQGGMEALENMNPLDILAYQYDVVCNGYEMASGAVRNHDPELMVKAFEIAGYTEKEVETRFGALYNAFQYGTPPHAGAAPGLDRMVMLISDSDNIREVIAFPKNKKARDLLMRAPNTVTDKQLKDVHIKVDIQEK